MKRLTKPGRLAIQAIATVAVLYAMAFGFLDWSMYQSPETFSRIMRPLGATAPFVFFPFETMWMRARSGHIQPGDTAPDFSLPVLGGGTDVTLSSFRGREPVVLVFGSYT